MDGLLLLSAVAVFGKGMQGMEDDQEVPTMPEPFNLRAALTSLAKYDEVHPGFFQGVFIWIAVGVVLYSIGLSVLLYSEVRACLVVRDQDFRARLLKTQMCLPGAQLADLKENEAALLAPRAYTTFFAGMIFFLSIGALLFPLCDIFSIIGLPSGPCLLILTVGALLFAVCTVCGWMALVWLFTRPWAALVLASIAVTGQMVVPSGNLLMILMWCVAASMGGVLYFYYLPNIYAEKRWETPAWLQDVGLISVSLDPKEWSNSFSRAYEAHEVEIERSRDAELSSYQ